MDKQYLPNIGIDLLQDLLNNLSATRLNSITFKLP